MSGEKSVREWENWTREREASRFWFLSLFLFFPSNSLLSFLLFLLDSLSLFHPLLHFLLALFSLLGFYPLLFPFSSFTQSKDTSFTVTFMDGSFMIPLFFRGMNPVAFDLVSSWLLVSSFSVLNLGSSWLWLPSSFLVIGLWFPVCESWSL